MLKLSVSLLNKEFLQASAKDGSWTATFLPTMGIACPPHCRTAPVTALLPSSKVQHVGEEPLIDRHGA